MLTLIVTEGTTPTFTSQILDGNDQPVAGSAMSSLKLTLFDDATGAIINSRNHEEVLAGDVTVDSSGILTWIMEVADTPIVTTGLAEEPHVAFFEISWAAGPLTRTIKQEIRIIVQNLTKFPVPV